MKRGLPPVVYPQSRTIVLGTLPGEKSIDAQQYYAHPQNQFWSILAAVYGCEIKSGYSKRLAVVRRCHLALWDVLASASRRGSLDESISDPEPNDFLSFFCAYPNVRTIVFNGEKSERMFRRYILQDLPSDLKDDLRLIDHLPSSSPMPGVHALHLEQKVERWQIIRTLQPPPSKRMHRIRQDEATRLPLKDAFLELAGTIVNASTCYDVWWEIQNVENQDKYSEIVKRYFTFFEANAGAQLVTMIVLLYQAYETRTDTQNIHSLLKRMEEESNASDLVDQNRRDIAVIMPIWKKVARARSTVIAHLSQRNTSVELMQAAELTPNEIRDLIRTSKSLLRTFAGHYGILGAAVLNMSAVGHTRQLMQALGAR